MNTLWSIVKANLIFALIGHLIAFRYGYADWQLYVYVGIAIWFVHIRETTLKGIK